VPIAIVAGALANKPYNGGEAWVRLSWIQGLARLGFQVVFIEQIEPNACVDTVGHRVEFAESAGLAYFRAVTRQFEIAESSSLIYKHGEQVAGLSMSELCDAADAAELLVNISGHLDLPELMGRLRRKVYLDIDPGYTQFWQLQGQAGSRLDDHDAYYTIAENIGQPDCLIPSGDIAWRKVRQPVVLDEWPVCATANQNLFTTVASWRGPFGPIQHGGRTFGLKAHEFRKFVELPKLSPQSFEVALNIHPADAKDQELLEGHGWHLINPMVAASDPRAFRAYVQNSGAEFSVSQGIYVDTRSGWFSDRTARYLASGKPVLVQDTGFSRTLPVGEGLLSFRTVQEAAKGAEQIAESYDRHSQAARRIAEEYFDSDTVLGRFLDELGVCA